MPASLFAHGASGNGHYAALTGGVTLCFGGDDKSLIRRHRKDDPSNAIAMLLANGGKPMVPLTLNPIPPKRYSA